MLRIYDLRLDSVASQDGTIFENLRFTGSKMELLIKECVPVLSSRNILERWLPTNFRSTRFSIERMNSSSNVTLDSEASMIEPVRGKIFKIFINNPVFGLRLGLRSGLPKMRLKVGMKTANLH